MLKELVSECKAEVSVRSLCVKGDVKLTEETNKAFKKDKKVLKGKIDFSGIEIRFLILFSHVCFFSLSLLFDRNPLPLVFIFSL